MKIVYFTEIADIDFFFDEDMKLFYWWCCGDASYNHEYMQGLFAKLEIEMKEIDWKDPDTYEKIKAAVKPTLREQGIEWTGEDDFDFVSAT